MSIFKPEFVLELGIGVFSTPIFTSYSPKKLICIENDVLWLDHIKTQCNFRSTDLVILHDLGNGYTSETSLKQITNEKRDSIIKYYKMLSDQIKEKSNYPKLLFVDNFACCRLLAINNLYDSFDILIYHDCEAAGSAFYGFNYISDEIKKEYNYYILKTSRTWTGCFIKQDIIQDNLTVNIDFFIKQYCTANQLNKKQFYLERQY